jgi:hypothetical protein
MVLRRVLGVLGSMNMMPVRQVRIVGSGFMVAFGVVLGGFMVMARSVLVVLRCLGMMIRGFLGHDDSFRSGVCFRHRGGLS